MEDKMYMVVRTQGLAGEDEKMIFGVGYHSCGDIHTGVSVSCTGIRGAWVASFEDLLAAVKQAAKYRESNPAPRPLYADLGDGESNG